MVIGSLSPTSNVVCGFPVNERKSFNKLEIHKELGYIACIFSCIQKLSPIHEAIAIAAFINKHKSKFNIYLNLVFSVEVVIYFNFTFLISIFLDPATSLSVS